MKLSERLFSCAALVRPGNTAVDVGTDHGYLAIYLLEQNICPMVYASDIREGPLSAARRNAEKAGFSDRIAFCLSDGLQKLPMDRIQTVICAGMGGDTIIHILEMEPSVFSDDRQLILQPQSKAADLRRWLASKGFSVNREKLSRDGKFLYSAMEAVWTGNVRSLSYANALMPEYLLRSEDALLKDYYNRICDGVRMTVQGLQQAKDRNEFLLAEYKDTLHELNEMGDRYGIG